MCVCVCGDEEVRWAYPYSTHRVDTGRSTRGPGGRANNQQASHRRDGLVGGGAGRSSRTGMAWPVLAGAGGYDCAVTVL